MKNARRKFEVPMPAAISCRTWREEYREACCVLDNCKTKYACIVGADESARSVWKELFIKAMKIILQGKESIHWTATILCTNSFLHLKQWKYQMQKQQWIKNGRNLKMFQHGSWRKSERKQRWSLKQGKTAEPYIFCHLNNSELEPTFQKFQGRVVLRGDIVKRWFRQL